MGSHKKLVQIKSDMKIDKGRFTSAKMRILAHDSLSFKNKIHEVSY